jgi:hypothetical protein
MKGSRNQNDILLRYFVGSAVLLASLTLMATFACLVVAKQESAQAATQILTATGVVGLMASICVNYAPNLENEERKIVVRCGELFLLACICLIFGLFVKYGSETLGQAAYIKESKALSKIVGDFGLLSVKAFFLLGVILGTAGAKDLTLHLFKRLHLGAAIPPTLNRIMLWQVVIIISIFAVAFARHALLDMWRWAWDQLAR